MFQKMPFNFGLLIEIIYFEWWCYELFDFRTDPNRTYMKFVYIKIEFLMHFKLVINYIVIILGKSLIKIQIFKSY